VKLYLSGPMTGRPGFNYPAFHDAAARLRGAGHEVFNPAESFGGDTSLPRDVYMRHDLEQLLQVEAVAVLPGWEASHGATLEVRVAHELGLPVVDADTLEPVPHEPWLPAPAPRLTVLEEAARITSRDRQDVYGHPADDFAKTIGMLNALLADHLAKPLERLHVPLILECVKLARLSKSLRHIDSWTDVAGYARTAEMVIDRELEEAG
jgi:hypothetical protein